MAGTQRTYEIQRSFIVLMQVAVWFFAAMAVLSLFLPLLDDKPKPNPEAFYVVSAGLSAIFIAFGVASYLGLRKARTSSLATDEQGLWRMHVGRDKGLVRWESIKSVRERPLGQRLELIGFVGERLLDIEYQLRGFDELRSHVLSKLPKTSCSYPQRYARKATYVSSLPVFMLLAVGGVWWSVSVGQVWLAVGLLVILILGVHEFVTSVTAITIWRDHLLIEFPWRKVQIRLTDIKALLFADTHNQGARVPQLALQLISGKVIKLQGLGVDQTDLYRQLSALLPTHA